LNTAPGSPDDTATIQALTNKWLLLQPYCSQRSRRQDYLVRQISPYGLPDTTIPARKSPCTLLLSTSINKNRESETFYGQIEISSHSKFITLSNTKSFYTSSPAVLTGLLAKKNFLGLLVCCQIGFHVPAKFKPFLYSGPLMHRSEPAIRRRIAVSTKPAIIPPVFLDCTTLYA